MMIKDSNDMTGKEKCKYLRDIRVKMAAQYGIPYTPQECNNKGDCSGSCPMCDKEAMMIMEKIKCY